jgi:hypothetical protein
LPKKKKKAFDEGDKIISIGVSNGINEVINTNLSSNNYQSVFTPSVTFDYGLKGTRGLISIGGFASFSSNQFSSFNNYNGYGYNISPDGLYYNSKMEDIKSTTFTTGLRLGIHYSTRKWDLYGGLMAGIRTFNSKGGVITNDYYKGTPNNPFNEFVRQEKIDFFNKNTTNLFLSPYAGARYFVTKKVSLNLEVGQYTGNIGFGFKF